MLPLPLQQFFNSLIKKGRGLWPYEALATSLQGIGEVGATSIP